MLAATVATFATDGTSLFARQQPPADASALEVIQIRPNFYVIAGDGANIAVQLGTDGVVIVDTGTGNKAKQVIAEIRKLSTRPIRYVINTSADPDHVGGNDELSAAGQSVIPTGGLNEIGAAGGRAPILAEENVQSRMAAPRVRSRRFPSAHGRP
jgi:glyoxylase-like metal-dependent hydrolase (beta-lactamase superfamily II)